MSVIAISKRGSLTLPKSLRKKLGLENMKKPLLQLEETEDGIVLRPVITAAVRSFKAAIVKEWIKEDQSSAQALKLWKR